MIDLINKITANNADNIHSVLIVKDNALVFEEYFSGDDIDLSEGIGFSNKKYSMDTLHCQASATKSITGILIGIAIDQGIINLDDKLTDFYPEYEPNDSRMYNITIEHMLTMTSGIPWDESFPYTDSRNSLNQQMYSEDPIEYIFGLSLTANPGTVFIYNSGTTNVLGDIISKASGTDLEQFANDYLFEPLGITDFQWVCFPHKQDLPISSSTLYLRPRDMAKIGQLVLQNGNWAGNQIVSKNWIDNLSENQFKLQSNETPIPNLMTGYGFQWWIGDLNGISTYFAGGWGGQFIFVVPELDMVIVFTGGNYGGSYEGFTDLITKYIIYST
jgi:CubicO group peptidase (beta-lactamase class C family)